MVKSWKVGLEPLQVGEYSVHTSDTDHSSLHNPEKFFASSAINILR